MYVLTTYKQEFFAPEDSFCTCHLLFFLYLQFPLSILQEEAGIGVNQVQIVQNHLLSMGEMQVPHLCHLNRKKERCNDNFNALVVKSKALTQTGPLGTGNSM